MDDNVDKGKEYDILFDSSNKHIYFVKIICLTITLAQKCNVWTKRYLLENWI